MNARALCLVALAALASLPACDRGAHATVTAPPAPPRVAPPERGAHHEDPDAPFTLAVESRDTGALEAEVVARVVPTADLPSLSLGVSLPQELTALSSPVHQEFTAARAGAPLTLRVRVRRTTPGPHGVVVRAWAEARDQGVVLGDEREAAVFGAPAPTQPPNERVVRTPDGTLLHDTVID